MVTLRGKNVYLEDFTASYAVRGMFCNSVAYNPNHQRLIGVEK
jgi:hypothetical protein